MQRLRTDRFFVTTFDLDTRPQIQGREFAAMGMDIMKVNLRFRVRPTACPAGKDFICVWFKNVEGFQSVEAGFGPNRFETWDELIDAIRSAIRQVETQREYPDEDDADEADEEPAPAAASGGAGGGSSSAPSAPAASNSASSAAASSSLPALSDAVPRDSSAVSTAVDILRTVPDLLDDLDLFDTFAIQGREMGLCAFNIRFKRCPAACPPGRDFLKVWIRGFDSSPTVEAGFGPNYFGIWSEFIQATRRAVVQVKTRREFPDDDDADDDEDDAPAPAPVAVVVPAPAPVAVVVPAPAPVAVVVPAPAPVAVGPALPALTAVVPVVDASVDILMRFLRADPALSATLNLDARPAVKGREFLAYGMDIMSISLDLRVRPAACPAGKAFIAIWFRNVDGGTKTVEAGFGPNYYDTWAEMIEAIRSAIRQVETQSE